MCIVLLTTAHPAYALIVIDNRDEFILRPTSRPHWWTAKAAKEETGGSAEGVAPANGTAGAEAAPANGTAGAARAAPPNGTGCPPPQSILSSRDLQRPEHGTWLGITRAGHFAVLTNFREDAPDDAAHPVHGARSRGGMVTAWLTADAAAPAAQFVAGLLAGGAVRGVGGFSLICGKLRRRCFEGSGGGGALAIVSNRADELAQVPWIAGERGAVYGLSNARYDEPEVWPKVRDGKAALRAVVAEHAAAGVPKPTPESEEALRAALFAVLDRDTLPRRPDLSFEAQIALFKDSIFIPALGDRAHADAMAAAAAGGPRAAPGSAEAVDRADADAAAAAAEELALEERPDQPATGFMTGLYGTQRQTVLLVDWNGRVAFTERALWDANGHAIPRGQGDVHVEFTIDGWDDAE